jgi:outer membrane lipoprotein-sorting protein
MKRFLLCSCLLLTISSSAQDALSIVKKADEKMRGSSSLVEMTINIIRPAWKRSMELKAWTKGTKFSMIHITAPAKDMGITFLKRNKEVWNWYPALERTIKLPPSMMSQSWMGTDFTNDDLVKESSAVVDYTHSIIGDTTLLARKCYVIQMIPKPEAAVVWSKVIVCIDATDFMELHSRFYDEDGTLVNTMNAYDPKMMDGRLIPTRFEMVPADKKNQKTEMIYRNIKYNQPIDDSFFTIEKMKTVK